MVTNMPNEYEDAVDGFVSGLKSELRLMTNHEVLMQVYVEAGAEPHEGRPWKISAAERACEAARAELENRLHDCGFFETKYNLI